MFQSKAVSSQWDTWAFVENGTYYAYYLVTEFSPGEGFGVATSPDGQHWTDHGYVFHGPSWTEHKWWEGTGSVWRAPDYNTTGRERDAKQIDNSLTPNASCPHLC